MAIESLKRFIINRFPIKSQTEFNELMMELYRNKLITVEDTSAVKANLLIFPMTLDHFLRMITELFNPDYIKDVELGLEEFAQQLNDCKSTINFWKAEGMTNKELKCLLLAFEKIKEGVLASEGEFEKVHDKIQNKKEQVMYLKDKIADFEKKDEMKTSFYYQQEEAPKIEKEFSAKRVRDVHYRNHAIKVIKTRSDDVVIQIGFCIDKDFPVEVYKIPKIYLDFQKMEQLMYMVNARKELFLSKYFPKYLGSNLTSDPNYSLYFMEYFKGKSMKELLEKSLNKMNPGSALYSLWLKEIFKAFRDLLDKTTHVPVLPIKPKQIFVGDTGIKIFIKNLSFTGIRRGEEDSHERLEAKLLKNYAEIMLTIIEYEDLNDLDKLSSYSSFCRNLRNFLEGLLNAEEDLKNYMEGLVHDRLKFANVERYPFLEDILARELDVVELVTDYHDLYKEID